MSHHNRHYEHHSYLLYSESAIQDATRSFKVQAAIFDGEANDTSTVELWEEAGLYSCAHDAESWEKEIKNFIDYKNRNKHAKSFYEIFHKKFNKENRTNNFVNAIKSLIK